MMLWDAGKTGGFYSRQPGIVDWFSNLTCQPAIANKVP